MIPDDESHTARYPHGAPPPVRNKDRRLLLLSIATGVMGGFPLLAGLTATPLWMSLLLLFLGAFGVITGALGLWVWHDIRQPEEINVEQWQRWEDQ